METKQVPGYVPAQTISNDHPGHGEFAGKPGYTNTPGILDPEEPKGSTDTEESGTAAKKTTTTKSSGAAASKSS
jgi:hypothetical protein